MFFWPSRDEIIAEAKSLPDLISRAEQFDPTLAKRLQGEATAGSKTVLGNIAAMGVSWAVTRLGLGWDPDTCALVSGLVAAAAVAASHWLANQPLGPKPGAPIDSYLDSSTTGGEKK